MQQQIVVDCALPKILLTHDRGLHAMVIGRDDQDNSSYKSLEMVKGIPRREVTCCPLSGLNG